MAQIVNNAHTPGPWKKSSKTWDDTEIPTIVGPDGQVICQVDTEFSAYPSGAFVSPAEAGPNWDLICASPDLLEALRKAPCAGPGLSAIKHDERGCWRCAAIAKAEGRLL